jgi:hypothetical protein
MTTTIREGFFPTNFCTEASGTQQLEQTFPQKRTLMMILELRYIILINNVKVGRPGLEPGTKALKELRHRIFSSSSIIISHHN